MVRTNADQYVISSYPRVGSTTLARALSLFPDLQCAIEPFHPQRLKGSYHTLVTSTGNVTMAMKLLRYKWAGLKHVWDPISNWPFEADGDLNIRISMEPDRVILIRRANVIQRYVSQVIARRLHFWIGEKREYENRLCSSTLPILDPELTILEAQKEVATWKCFEDLVVSSGRHVLCIEYEDLFGEGVSERDKWRLLVMIIEFLRRDPPSWASFKVEAASLLASDKRWASELTYRSLQNAVELDQEAKRHGLGCLF